MKVSYLITVLVLVIAMVVPSNASAQNTVTNLNFNDPAACGGYLTSHPMDTIVGRVQLSADTTKVIKVYLENGVVAPEALRRVNTFVVVANKKVRSVKKEANNVIVVSDVRNTDGSVYQDTTTYGRTTIKDMSFQEKEDYLRGSVKAVNPEHKDLDGKFRHRAYVALGGGVVFARATSPEASIHLGYETCHFLYELEGVFSSTKYTESADYRGRYITFSGIFNAGWKFWQDSKYRQSVAVIGFGGYGYQKSDGNKAMDRSRNYGLIAGGKLRYTFQVSDWLFWGQAGWKIVPEVPRGEEQNCNAGGFFTSFGIGYVF